MGQFLSLESFEEALIEDTGPSEDFNLGYQEGLAAGTAAAKMEAAALNEAFVQALSEIEFTYAEARGQVLDSLKPLLSAMVERILPHCVETGFAGVLVDILFQAASADADGAINLHIHPGQREGIQNATRDLPGKVVLHDDPTLGAHSVWIKQDRQESLLDMDSLLERISDTLAAVHQPQNRIETHG